MYMVITQIHGDNGIQRWFYGTYPTQAEANEAAYELGGSYPVYHVVIPADQAQAWGVQNLPY